MVQVISVVQEKGGAGKSTLLAGLAALMADDGAKVLIIDTDPQKTISSWAEKENSNVDFLYEDDDAKLMPTVAATKNDYDVIFIDTAGFKSVMTVYAISAADLVLIPSKASEPDARGAIKTHAHVQSVSMAQSKEIPAYIILNDVDKMARITNSVKDAIVEQNVPLLKAILWSRTGLKEMMSEGGLPNGTALAALKEVMAELQIRKAIETRKAA